jgi:UDP-hydrolysing UDP-N-acetyl-D-glucosamine 2-epimerase
MPQRICVITGSRAEYGLLYWVLKELQADPGVDLQLVVTGMHLSPEFGLTVRQIEKDGFPIGRRVEMLLSSDSPGGIAKSIGLGVSGLSDAIEQLQPEVVVLLGDRFEMLAAAQACLIQNVPLAHIAGGDTSEGAFDESIRHSITKMAHVHFVTNELSARRVRQLGEDPRRIHLVGSPGLDHLQHRSLLGRPALEELLGAPLGARNLLITFHPVTLDAGAGLRDLAELLAALDDLEDDISLWITRPNADPGARSISTAIDQWAETRSRRARIYSSLGHLCYLSLLAQVDAVVGNSSSGLYEAPSMGVGTVNIGNRQRGRLAAESVMHCEPERRAISSAISQAMAADFSGVVNPYGDGRSAARIVAALRTLPPRDELLMKTFHLLEREDV